PPATTRTAAVIDSTAPAGIVAGGALTVTADSTHTLLTKATASPGGSTANGTSPSATTATASQPGGFASAPGGAIGVAGALAFSELDQETIATVGGASPLAVTAGGTGVAVSAVSSGSAITEADGSAVGGSAAGVGVGVSVNLANARTEARIGNVAFTATGVTASATAAPRTVAGVNEYRAQSVSGAGGASIVGAAGALAVNIASFLTRAAILSGVTVTAPGADLAFAATADNDTIARALPGTLAGATTGIGASIALNIANDRAIAEVGDGATLTGVADLSLTAQSTSPATAEAQGGVASEAAISTVMAVNISNVTTLSRLGTGSPLTLTGTYTSTATQTAPVVTTATGNVSAEDGAAVSAVIALTFADHAVRAELARDLTAAAVTLKATGMASSATTASASAAGVWAAAQATDA
ncbi:hypothetical protein ACI3KY_20270, partial [Microbacterium sp. ZW T2_14]|uniref:hypothetical protein n=1 Tax=Microbacterium sp. ZW T2_14 TaxID=3378079 RepID=UPI003854389F